MLLRKVMVEQVPSGLKKFRAKLEIELLENAGNGNGGGVKVNETVAGARLVKLESKSAFEAVALAIRYGKAVDFTYACMHIHFHEYISLEHSNMLV